MIVRPDWLLGVIAVQQVQLFLYELLAESNKPLPLTGPKQWSSKLTAPAAAPGSAARRGAHRAIREVRREATFTLFFTEVPPIAQDNDIAWPHQLEAAVSAY